MNIIDDEGGYFISCNFSSFQFSYQTFLGGMCNKNLKNYILQNKKYLPKGTQAKNCYPERGHYRKKLNPSEQKFKNQPSLK